MWGLALAALERVHRSDWRLGRRLARAIGSAWDRALLSALRFTEARAILAEALREPRGCVSVLYADFDYLVALLRRRGFEVVSRQRSEDEDQPWEVCSLRRGSLEVSVCWKLAVIEKVWVEWRREASARGSEAG